MTYLGLYEWHAGLKTLTSHLFRPDARLYLAYVCLVKQQHAQSALSYTTTYAQRQFSVEQLTVEVQLLPFFLAFNGKLAQQCLLIYSYSHGRQLERTVKHRIPYQYVAVQSGPLVVGRG